jgi:hypothetical protein
MRLKEKGSRKKRYIEKKCPGVIVKALDQFINS